MVSISSGWVRSVASTKRMPQYSRSIRAHARPFATLFRVISKAGFGHAIVTGAIIRKPQSRQIQSLPLHVNARLSPTRFGYELPPQEWERIRADAVQRLLGVLVGESWMTAITDLEPPTCIKHVQPFE